MTRRLGVVGYPIRHSISPAMHQAALDELGIDARYERWEVAPADLAAWVATLREPAVVGASVTVPHKQAVMSFLDELAPAARAIGAVNTIVAMDGRLRGDNTDAAGFARALRDAAMADTPRRVVLLGAGGAARAVAWALLDGGVRELAIFNRDRERARALAAALAPPEAAARLETAAERSASGAGGASTVEAFALDAPQLDARLASCDLLVNTTSVGMRPGERLLRPEQVPAHALVVDIVYKPPETALLADAAARGARTQNGLPMLVYQAALAFTLWTGREPPVATMFRAAREALA
jgi:shikimate dehydrogenase